MMTRFSSVNSVSKEYDGTKEAIKNPKCIVTDYVEIYLILVENQRNKWRKWFTYYKIMGISCLGCKKDAMNKF